MTVKSEKKNTVFLNRTKFITFKTKHSNENLKN